MTPPAVPSNGAVTVRLPRPSLAGGLAVGAALRARRSVREFAPVPLTLATAADLLWAAQGLSGGGLRTTPSAGATHPLEVSLVAGDVVGLSAGCYRYLPLDHALFGVTVGDCRREIAAAAHEQGWIALAPALLLIAAVEARTAARYGRMARRYVDLEAGCAAENVALAAVAAGLATVMVGAFDAGRLATVLRLPAAEEPVCLMPVGRAWRT